MSQPVVSSDGLRTYNLAATILSLVENAALGLSVTLPPKRIVTSGEAVFDCELVAVTAMSLSIGIPDSASGGAIPVSGFCGLSWTAAFDVDIVRCVPLWKMDRNGVVAAEQINDVLPGTSADAEVLMETVTALSGLPENFGDVVCSISFPPPVGGFGSVRASIQAVLP